MTSGILMIRSGEITSCSLLTTDDTDDSGVSSSLALS